MALYELEDGRLVPAQFGHAVPDGFSDGVLNAVRAQVLEIVSRPLFPIAWNDGAPTSEAAPRLTALDAAGQVVAVEVVKHLDADLLIEALSRLADSAAMSWTDLAREYPGGINNFKAGWAKFRESMPTSPPNGPRMILVAAEIAEEVRPALDVLSSSGVEVHEMSLRQTSNGRSFLEVEPVGHRLYNHRFTPVVESATVAPELAATARRTRRHRSAAVDVAPDVLARRQRIERDEQDADASLGQVEPPTVTSESMSSSAQKRSSRPAPARSSMRVRRPTAIPASSGLPTRASRRAARSGEAVGFTPRRRSRRSHVESGSRGPITLDGNGLVALAQILGSDASLSLGPGRRTPAGAVLSLEGRIILPTGVFVDPTAALASCGYAGEDGWDAWHLGDSRGPSLRESVQEVNAAR